MATTTNYCYADLLNNYNSSVDEMTKTCTGIYTPHVPFPDPYKKENTLLRQGMGAQRRQAMTPTSSEDMCPAKPVGVYTQCVSRPQCGAPNPCRWPRRGEPFNRNHFPCDIRSRILLDDVIKPARIPRPGTGDWMHYWAEDMYRLNYCG